MRLKWNDRNESPLVVRIHFKKISVLFSKFCVCESSDCWSILGKDVGLFAAWVLTGGVTLIGSSTLRGPPRTLTVGLRAAASQDIQRACLHGTRKVPGHPLTF